MKTTELLQPKQLGALIGWSLVLLLLYGIANRIQLLLRCRLNYHDIPSPPRHWLFGNLKELGEKLDPSNDRHPDYGMEEMWNELGCPAAFLMDMAPVTNSMLVVADPTIAEAVAQPSNDYKYSLPKSDTLDGLWRLFGTESMIVLEGEMWRNLRKRFNKGFSPAHLHSLSPLVVAKTKIFVDRLKAAAEKDAVFSLRAYAQDLATDIITTIAIKKDFGSQSVPDGEGAKSRFGFLTASRTLPGLVYKVGQGFKLLYWLDPTRPAKSWFYDQVQNRILDDLIRSSLKADQQDTGRQSAKAIVQLALSGLRPTTALVQNTRDQIKSFIFAGQDTTSTTIQWMCYELSKAPHSARHARYLAKLTAEHDEVLGPNATTLDILSSPDHAAELLGTKLPYTTAFVKETLRLHPPAGTARRVPRASSHHPPLYLDIDGVQTRVDGLRIYNSHWLIQRHPKVWGADAHEFNPDRWLDEAYVKNLPAGAWRPFERGPRNCIGQELALLEIKVVLCAVARTFTFEKVGLNGRDGQREVYNSHEVTAVPVDGMAMKVHLRREKEE